MARDLPVGEAMIDTDLVPDDVLLDSIFFRQFLVHHDIRHLCTCMVFDGRSDGIPMTGCSIYGSPKAASFGERNRQLHRLTLNHLSRSLGTMLRLRDAELRLASTLAALDRLDGGIVLLGWRGEVLFANRAAMRILESGDGISLRRGALHGDGIGWLQPSSLENVERLRHEIAATIDADPTRVRHFSQGLMLPRPSGRRGLVLRLAPLSERCALAHADQQAHAIAFLTDPDRDIVLDEALMGRLYRITPAEARLAQELLVGEALPEIAHRLGRSHATLKTQLQSLFAKTRTHRQADLVKLLMSLAKSA